MNLQTKISTLFLVSVFLVLVFSVSLVKANSSDDAISIRVIPNPEHYSIKTWYQKQDFTGSPQSLVVDGYNAIRNGRTVYVNAANIDTSNQQIYTNIYLISYNQEPREGTTDILGQIISHWNFNINIDSHGKCAISSMSCREDKDCPGGYVCGNEQFSFQQNKCVKPDETNDLSDTPGCLTDNDCSAGLSCTSLKARVTRDVKRLGKLQTLKSKLDSYKNEQGNYPILGSGTYVPHLSVSTWPSWNSELSRELKLTSNIVDPINSLGSCPNYDLETCWNQASKSFYDKNINDGLDLPDNSNVLAYKTNPRGDEVVVCANMESGYNTTSGFLQNNNCGGSIGYTDETEENTAPEIVSHNLEGKSGESFSGYIKARDAEADTINWQLDTSVEDDWSGWSSPPSLERAGTTNQRKLYANEAGDPGTYTVDVILSDNKGATNRETLNIKIGDTVPEVEVGDTGYYKIDSGEEFDYTLSFEDNDFNGIPSNTLEVDYNLPDGADGETGENEININNTDKKVSLGHGLYAEMTEKGEDSYRMDISGVLGDTDGDGEIEENLNIDETTFEFTFTVTDEDGNSTSKNFNIYIRSNPPMFEVENCQNRIKKQNRYYCPIEILTDNNLSFEYNNLPENLAGNDQGVISGGANQEGEHNISVTAKDGQGNSETQNFNLEIVTHCGDKVVQKPNDLGEGGPNGEGYELCDREDGTAYNAESSNRNYQYECTDKCIYTGGWCGDGETQDSYEKCEPDDPNSIAQSAKDSGANKQYDCDSSDCTYTGGYCGDDKVQDLYEQCEKGDPGSYAQTAEESKDINQYDCTTDDCTYTGGWCGDDKIQDNYEQCDSDNTCCKLSNCTWNTSNYSYVGVDFINNNSTFSLDYSDSNKQTELDFPENRGYDKDSPYLDIDLNVDGDKIDGTGVVYVTDRSGSMPDGMPDVKEALTGDTSAASDVSNVGGSLKDLYNFATQSVTTGEIIFDVGLVSFGGDVSSSTAMDIKNDNNVISHDSTISNYTDGGGTPTNKALKEAKEILNNGGNYDKEVVVLLTDGDPNSSTTTVNTTATDLKSNGKEIYTIAYGDALGNDSDWLDQQDLRDSLCDWSSDNGENCFDGGYSYKASEADTAFDKITNEVTNKPDLEIKVTAENDGTSENSTTNISFDNNKNSYSEVGFSLPGNIVNCPIAGSNNCTLGDSTPDFEATLDENDAYGVDLSDVYVKILEKCE